MAIEILCSGWADTVKPSEIKGFTFDYPLLTIIIGYEYSMGDVMERWIPLTQYAIEEGVSISTLRRKIKANSIDFKLDDGRYLIRSRSSSDASPQTRIFSHVSSDAPIRSALSIAEKVDTKMEIPAARKSSALDEMELKWRALEARINGLAKKVDYLVEQNSELNMLVKVFEEKLDATL